MCSILKKLIIIPAYNEAKNIEKVIKDITEYAKDFDYIIINDCSTDNTKEVCLKNNFRFLNLPINLGIGGAMQTGYKFAQEYHYDIAVQFDGDGQHDARFLNKMFENLQQNSLDMIIGSRFISKEGFQSSFLRRMGIQFFGSLFKFLYHQEITDATSGLRMVNRKVIDDFCRYYPKDYPEPETISSCLRKKYKVSEISVEMKEREYGESSINFRKSIYYMGKVTLAIFIDKMKRV